MLITHQDRTGDIEFYYHFIVTNRSWSVLDRVPQRDPMDIYWDIYTYPYKIKRFIGLLVWLWRLRESKNLIREAGKLEIQGRVALQVQRQCARKPGRCDIADEFRRQSAGKFLVAPERISIFVNSGLWLIRWGPSTSWRAIYFTQNPWVYLFMFFKIHGFKCKSHLKISWWKNIQHVWPIIWALWLSQIDT